MTVVALFLQLSGGHIVPRPFWQHVAVSLSHSALMCRSFCSGVRFCLVSPRWSVFWCRLPKLTSYPAPPCDPYAISLRFIHIIQSINQSKHISIAPYVASESYTGLVCRTSNGVGHIINVKLRRARLVLDWWSTFGGSTIPVFSWPTQPGRPCVGRCSEYWRAEWVCFALWLYPTFETTYIEGAAGIVSHTTSLVFYGSVTITT